MAYNNPAGGLSCGGYFAGQRCWCIREVTRSGFSVMPRRADTERIRLQTLPGLETRFTSLPFMTQFSTDAHSNNTNACMPKAWISRSTTKFLPLFFSQSARFNKNLTVLSTHNFQHARLCKTTKSWSTNICEYCHGY